MERVAYCESTLRQYNTNGEVLKGKQVPADTGVFQVNTKYHLETAKKMGIDIFTLEGNVAYAKYLYDKNGLRDWFASKPCWNRK